jgi:hypothetical protein
MEGGRGALHLFSTCNGVGLARIEIYFLLLGKGPLLTSVFNFTCLASAGHIGAMLTTFARHRHLSQN